MQLLKLNGRGGRETRIAFESNLHDEVATVSTPFTDAGSSNTNSRSGRSRDRTEWILTRSIKRVNRYDWRSF
jgi:hypothetical protein